MPDMTQTPQTPFSVLPANADINLNAACQFSVDPPDTEVVWEIKPQIGQIDNGVYTSPTQIKMPQTVLVVATSKVGTRSTAVINIADVRTPILWLGWYAILLGAIVALGILLTWSYLYQSDSAAEVIVNPVLVTLDPGRDDNFGFVASVIGSANNAVVWSVEGGGEIDSTGTFRQKIQSASGIDKTVTVTARSVAFPSRIGTAVIRLRSGRHLEIEPQPKSVFPTQQVPFRAPNVTALWSVSRSDIAKISPDGVFTAGTPTKPPAIVQITAWGADRSQAAVATVIEMEAEHEGSGNVFVLVFVMFCGTLGSMIYFSSSFVSYVGNQTFRSSWTWFYISRPFVGGALALIFFFIVGSGLINGTSVGELMKIGMISALVGLFSDKAIKKLSDVLDVLLATKDDRKDKVDDSRSRPSTALTPDTSTQPKITSIDPPSIPHDTDSVVVVHGTNLTQGYKVKVNEKDVDPITPTEQNFKINIPASEAKVPSVAITLITGQETVTSKLTVK